VLLRGRHCNSDVGEVLIIMTLQRCFALANLTFSSMIAMVYY